MASAMLMFHKRAMRDPSPYSTKIAFLEHWFVKMWKRKSSQQFRISRLKNVPQNEEPGDCGVYALKYIECKATGCGFEGLSDQCIPAMRIKLAAEIYDEVSGL
ncbi:hypothetical protein F2Q69_00043823 [Brassica cretica]|uniref:Ubiquitin-like protease family profile domain-containing protein n=1 Tax=Brassica cretica TaxID=69181 RepID=A0A8S9NBG6_BRACR|nr:hypothetical protein F2Q69_00043823 [Brassica cretica]